MWARWFAAVIGVSLAAPLHGQSPPSRPQEPIEPLPLAVPREPARVALGEKLFYDPRISHDGAMSCGTCHIRAKGGGDGLPRSINNDGKPGELNTPSIYNLAFNYRLTWSGRFRTIEEQTKAVIHNPSHINTSWAELLPKLKADAEYASLFRKAYPQGLQVDTLIDAIASYERSLVTPNAPFDRFLRGDSQAITAGQLHGYRQFKAYGCIACHQGINIGGNLFQKFGQFEDYFAKRGHPLTKADLGRFAVTGREADRFVFRVPSLRNVAVTAPYLHDGSIATLDEMVRVMARVQLGRKMPEADVQAIVAFLDALTGELAGKSLAPETSR